MRKKVDREFKSFGVKDVYRYYVNYYSKSVVETKRTLDSLLKTRKYFINKLPTYAILIRGFGKIDWTKLETIKDIRLADFKAKYFSVMMFKQNPIPSAEFIINRIVELNKNIREVEIKVEGGFVPIRNRDLVWTILEKFNTKLAHKIVNEGYTYEIGKGLGKLGVIAYHKSEGSKKSKKNIDWKNTLLNKQRIIAEGGIPYQALYDENGRSIGNNGGEYYYRYYPEDYGYVIKWYNKSPYIKNIVFYMWSILKRHTKVPYSKVIDSPINHNIYSVARIYNRNGIKSN